MEYFFGYLIVGIICFTIGIFVTRWVFRIDYICARLTAMSANILKIREEMERRSQTQEKLTEK